MTQHTPGPWTCRPDQDNYGAFVVTVFGGNPTPLHSDEANARLIAAAPELLEACQLLSATIALIRKGERNGAVFGSLSAYDDMAQAAIAKATGG